VVSIAQHHSIAGHDAIEADRETANSVVDAEARIAEGRPDEDAVAIDELEALVTARVA
jgi:hypothetical protein